MASAEIITIGTELLLGQLVDTNTAVIASALAEAGVDVYREISVGDNQARIAQAVRDSLSRADAVICAGGLGPTVDDVTRQAVAEAAQRALRTDQATLGDLRAFFQSVGRKMPSNNEQQAMFPEGAQILPNPHGTAPGFALDVEDGLVIVLPGPPHEMEPMLRHHALPLLAKRFGTPATIVTRVLHTVGLPESEVDARIHDLFHAGVNPTIAVLAHRGTVEVKLTAKASTHAEAANLIAQLQPIVSERLGDHVFSTDGRSLPTVLGDELRRRQWTIATAESCTGGLIGAMITSVAGSSDYFLGGAISYSNESKTRLLSVAPELIDAHGAVSEEVAIAMAIGTQELFRATLALSVTGVAGPEGGTEEKPVGLVYIALAEREGEVEVQRLRLSGDREAVRRRAALNALMLAWRAAKRQ